MIIDVKDITCMSAADVLEDLQDAKEVLGETLYSENTSRGLRGIRNAILVLRNLGSEND